jgi:hypothetical protein
VHRTERHIEEFEVRPSDERRLIVRSWPLWLLLSACTQAVDDGAAPPPGGAGFGPGAAGPAASAPDNVFVAVVSGSEGYNAPEALPSGSFLVEDGCLVFRYGGSRGLRRTPLLPPGSRLAVDVGSGMVRIGGHSVALGEQVTLAGGDLPRSVVKTAIPPRCPRDVMLVTEAVRG